MENPEAYLGRLRPIYIFKGLTDQEILEVASAMEVERQAAGEVVFEEGTEGHDFYIIHQGQVKVLRKGHAREPRQVGTLGPGDFFGEGALLYGRRRSATIETASAVELLRLGKDRFDELVRRFPRMRPNLLLTHESHELYRQNKFNWLAPNEVVYLVIRRHKLLLYQSLFLPIVLGAVVALAAIWLAVYFERLWIAWAGALLEVPVAAWLLWNYVDWGNDFYIVTNQRLVYLEKIAGIYDSRVEAPLGSIMSVNIQTDDSVQRAVGMGDVVVRTFSGPIVLKSVANPGTLAAAIEEHWYRTRSRERELQVDQMKRSLRERIEPDKPRAPAARPGAPAGQAAQTKPEATAQPMVAAQPATGVRPAARRPQPLLKQLADFFSLRVRFEQGANVVYRKHWYILWQSVWKPTLGLLGLVALVTAAAGGVLPAAIPLSAVLLVAGVALVPLAGWWLYEYVDWRNDIYMVTPEQIFDVTKKPLGAETRKSAPLANVLSMKYERPGLLGVLLNYGTVVALVAGSEFRFDGVFDPVGVQNDVYRRIEAYNAKKASTEANKRRDELADWLMVYHKVQEELEGEERPRDDGRRKV